MSFSQWTVLYNTFPSLFLENLVAVEINGKSLYAWVILKITAILNFKSLDLKPTSEICYKRECLKGKYGQNRFMKSTLTFFFFLSKNHYCLQQNEKKKNHSIFCYENKRTHKFHAFMRRNNFGNKTEIDEFGFENNLKSQVYIYKK